MLPPQEIGKRLQKAAVLYIIRHNGEDIFKGVEADGEYIHAGHIGEIGISPIMTQDEENSLRGACRTQ